MAAGERQSWWRRWSSGWRAVLVCILLAALYRGTLLATRYDVPGDGPSRSAIAVAWAAEPHVLRCGGWPPGWTYLAGGFSRLLDAPLWSSRVLDLILGILSVPLVWSIAARTWGHEVALPAALALALLPLHAELSATSLTEVSFTFMLLLAWRLLLAAASSAEPRRAAYLVAGGLCVSFAQMLRYEGWLFAPALLVWWLVCHGRSRAVAVLAVLVTWFPLAWLAGNAACGGDAIVGLRAAVSEPSAGVGYGLAAALAHVATLATTELGWPLAAALLAGVLVEIAALVRGQASSARVLALGIAGTAWAFLLRFTISRGPSAWNRYAVMTLVVSLAFAFVPLRLLPRSPRARRGAVVATSLLLLVMVVPDLAGLRARHWLRPTPPVEAQRFARWLESWGAYVRVPILATPVGWELTFLGLCLPEAEPRTRTISGWISTDELRAVIDGLRGQGPILIVTRDGDEADLARIEHVAGRRLTDSRPVYETAGLRVHVAEIPAPP